MIKIETTLRPCFVEEATGKRKALFHTFTLEEGNAVVEFEDGSCTTVAPWNIVFADSKYKDYSFE